MQECLVFRLRFTLRHCAWFVLVKYFFKEALLLKVSDQKCGTLSNSGLEGLDRALILLYWK